MEKLSSRKILVVGLMLFSLFFGAGNLIIPPYLGQEAGSNLGMALLGFLITAVGFPILGIVSVAKTDGLNNLAGRVNDKFAYVYTILVYLSIGPLLGIPRAGSLPYEMVVAPFMGSLNINHRLALLIFTLVFFAAAYWLALTPSKLVDRMGKILTPILICLMLMIFLGKFIRPFGSLASPSEDYLDLPFVKGFLEGYLTMDTISALNFGLVISVVIRQMGIAKKEDIVSNIVKAGLIAGGLLVAIYGMLSYLGALSAGLYGTTANGAETLTNVVRHTFGLPGIALLALTFTLACLTTAVGLISSCSQYFTTVIEGLTYRRSVQIFVLWSLLVSNLGLSTILKISVPILNAIYPISLALIILSVFEGLKDKTYVYRTSILFTGIVSVLEALHLTLSGIGLRLELLDYLFQELLPFGRQGLGWIVPGLLGFSLGLLLDNLRKTKKTLERV